jgi:hypothetical protein
MCAQSVLAAVTLAAQPHYDIDLFASGSKPLINLFLTISESGMRKTRVDNVATRAIRERETKLLGGHKQKMARHYNLLEMRKLRREHIKKQHKNDLDAFQEAMDKHGSDPDAPRDPTLLMPDFTVDGLIHFLREHHVCGIFTSEGAMLVAGHAFDLERVRRTGAFFNGLWDKGDIRSVRVSTGTTVLFNRRCSAHLMMQPAVAHQFLSNPDLGDIGTLARFLVSYPESNMGFRPYHEPSPTSLATLDGYGEALLSLLKREPEMDGDQLAPTILVPSHAAKQMWIKFHDATERDLAPGGPLYETRAFAAKMAEHAGRLAAPIAVYEDPETREIGVKDMERGIEIIRYYGQELLRLIDVSAVQGPLTLAEKLLAWLRQRAGGSYPYFFHLADVYQYGPRAIQDRRKALETIEVLEEHGYLLRLEPGTMVDGRGRKDTWELVPV